MTPNRTARSRLALVFGLALLLALGTVAAQAQTLHLYACKVVCGYQSGNVRLLNDIGPTPDHQFEDLKPGNYATVCNVFNHDIFNPSQDVLPYLAVEGGGLIFLGAVNVPALRAAAIGCRDIAANLPVPPPPIFEGYLTLFTFVPDFKVDEVNTFESQNGYERHALWFFTVGGPFGLAAQSLGLSIPRITNPLGGPAGVLGPNQFLTASGAGGLGLGASIDVEEVRRVDIDLTDTTAEDNERLPPEVRVRLEETGEI